MSDSNKDQKADSGAPDFVKKPKTKKLGVEFGVDQNLPFSTPFYDTTEGSNKDADLMEILRESGDEVGPSVQQLITMRQMDGQARALYRLLTLPIRAALTKSTFVPADGGEDEAEFINNVFSLPPQQGGMTVTFHKVMSQLLSGLFTGFSAFEQVFWKPSFGPLKGKYSLKKLAFRPPETVTFITDRTGGFAGFRQKAYVNGQAIDAYIDRDYAFYYAAQEEERKFYGVSFFQSAFYHYDKKIKMYYIAHLAAQRAAVGTRVGTVPPNASKASKAEFAANLSNLALAQWMMIPEGYKVEMLKEGGTFPFLDYINHHNSQMSKSILASFFDENQGAGSNDKAVVSFGQPGDDMFMLMLQSIMDDIANQINHYIIPKLIDWNFTGGKYPKFQWAALTEEQKGVIAKTFDKLSTAGQSMNVTPEFMRELEKHMASEMGLEIDFEAIEKEEEAEAELLAEQQAALMDPAVNPDDAAVSEFEAAAGGGAAPADKVALSADSELIGMAQDLLSAATLELSRRVQTPEGVKKYNSPLGSLITEDGESAPREVTIERLMSLKGQLDTATKLGNTVAIKEASSDLLAAARDFAGDSKSVTSVLKSLSATPKPKK